MSNDSPPVVKAQPQALDPREILKATLDALDRLLKIFVVERYMYLALTAVSFVLMLYAVAQVLAVKSASASDLGVMFGSSGLIAASSARISWFFNKGFGLVEDIIKRIN